MAAVLVCRHCKSGPIPPNSRFHYRLDRKRCGNTDQRVLGWEVERLPVAGARRPALHRGRLRDYRRASRIRRLFDADAGRQDIVGVTF